MNWLRRLFCAHRYEWMRNIYGDEINLSGGKRSLWDCAGCNLLELDAVRLRLPDGTVRYLCPTCPELPPEKRREPDLLRAGLSRLINRAKNADENQIR